MSLPNVALVVAHPDDEIFASNLLYGCAKLECAVYVTCATKGGGGKLVGDPPLVAQENLRPYREQEMERSLSVYDIEELVFLGFEDHGLSSMNRQGVDKEVKKLLVDSLLEVQQKYQIDCFITHGSEGEYGHPMHRALHEAVREVVDIEEETAMLTFWANNGWNVFDERTNINDISTLDITYEGFPYHKLRSLLAHRTQWEYFAGEQPHAEAYLDGLREYASDHRTESYRLVTDPIGRGQEVLQSLSGLNRTETRSGLAHRRMWIYMRTLYWRISTFIQTMRYKLALRSRVKSAVHYITRS